MDIQNLIIFLAIGALAGWLAGIVMKGRCFGVIGNILVGIVGVVFGLQGIAAGGLIGAIILLFIISVIKKA